MNKQKIKTILTIAGILAAIFLIKSLDTQKHIQTMVEWIEGFGFLSPVIFIVFYILTAGYILPVILVTIIAGVLFGVFKGTLIVSIAFTLSSVIVFFIGHFHGEKLIPRKFQSSHQFKAISKVLKEDGFKFVFMFRFVPVVSSIILNLMCGLARIKPKDFIWGTFLGQLPGTFLYCYSGFLAKDIINAQDGMTERSLTDWAMLFVGIIATIIIMILASKKYKKTLKDIK